MTTQSTEVLDIPLARISPDPGQPRKVFDEDALAQLAESMRSRGLLQPIAVRPAFGGTGGEYLLIAGERRWRAAGILDWRSIPAIVRRDVDVEDATKLQLLENIVRQDLDPVEEANALKKMLDEGYTLKELGESLGMAPSQISWRVQMLGARKDVLDLVSAGQIKPAVAHAISKLSLNGQARVLRIVTGERLSYTEVVSLCDRVLAEENQTEMFVETKLTEGQKRTVRTFGEAFKSICANLDKLIAIEEKAPGSLADALGSETGVVESQVEQALKALYRVKKAMQTRRVQQLTGTD